MNLSLSKLNKKLICVTIGDIEGIGIQLLLKEFKKKKRLNFKKFYVRRILRLLPVYVFSMLIGLKNNLDI